MDDDTPPFAAVGRTAILGSIWAALGGAPRQLPSLQLTGAGDLPSVFAVTDLASGSVGAAGLAVAELVAARHGTPPTVTVDRRLASLWFGNSLHPEGWSLPPTWDAIAGDYQAADGWIRLHTNAPHHLAAAIAVLDVPAEQDRVVQAVGRWQAAVLEQAVVDAGGCAAAMRDMAAWAEHPQGRAVAAEPLLHHEPGDPGPAPVWTVPLDRPLQGVRVLDMTRVLAGPVATRFLAGFGAEVLRIDPPDWDEPAIVPGVTLGKRCARLDLRQPGDLATWKGLLRATDVLVHGYRPGALAGLGLDAGQRRALCPGLVDVSLDAYGWTGPWRDRRGFDSLVQMSCGIAAAGMHQLHRDRPTPLPVQALDHATGYIMAAAAIRGLTERLVTGAGCTVRASLARTAALLMGVPPGPPAMLAPGNLDDFGAAFEQTTWGPARRLRPPCSLDGAAMKWDLPARALGTATAAWVDQDRRCAVT